MAEVGSAASGQENVAANTDRELWRKGDGDGNGMSHYEPSIHVTHNGLIGIDVGGHVYEKPVEEWHRLAVDREGLRCESLTTLQRLVALALVLGDWDAEEGDAIPQDVWDALYAEGLVASGRDMTDEGYPYLTTEGRRALLEGITGV